MQFKDIVTEVQNIVDDDGYSPAQIKDYINEMILYAGALVDLPGLKRLGSFTTVVGQPYASLTNVIGGFSGRLLRVGDLDVTIYPNIQLLLDDYITDTYPDLTEEGDIEAVALEGSTLWYQYIPATETSYSILYYQNPLTLTNDEDKPSNVPEHLHRKLFVHGAAWIIFDQMEDEPDEKKTNSLAQFWHSFNEDNKHSGIIKLREWVGKNRRHYKSSVWAY